MEGNVLAVTEICNAAGFWKATKRHPFLLVVSPIFRTLTPEPSFAPKAKTDARGVARDIAFWYFGSDTVYNLPTGGRSFAGR